MLILRIFGYVLFGLGLVFFVMFVLADFGGAHLNWTVFLTSLFAVYIGLRLARTRKGSASKQAQAPTSVSSRQRY